MEVSLPAAAGGPEFTGSGGAAGRPIPIGQPGGYREATGHCQTRAPQTSPAGHLVAERAWRWAAGLPGREAAGLLGGLGAEPPRGMDAPAGLCPRLGQGHDAVLSGGALAIGAQSRETGMDARAGGRITALLLQRVTKDTWRPCRACEAGSSGATEDAVIGLPAFSGAGVITAKKYMREGTSHGVSMAAGPTPDARNQEAAELQTATDTNPGGLQGGDTGGGSSPPGERQVTHGRQAAAADCQRRRYSVTDSG